MSNRMFKLLIFLYFFEFSLSAVEELNIVRWSELGLKNICPKEEFFTEFDKVKHDLKKCLKFKHIDLDSDLFKLDDLSLVEDIEEEKLLKKHFVSISYSKNNLLNPFCKLKNNWNNCLDLIVDLDCIEPDSKSLIPVYIPRTVEEQLRRIYNLHERQKKTFEKFKFNDGFILENQHFDKDEKLSRQIYYKHQSKLKLEQLVDYFKLRCDLRKELHIDSLNLSLPKQQGKVSPNIDRWHLEAFPDTY